LSIIFSYYGENITFAYSPANLITESLVDFIPFEYEVFKLENSEKLDEFLSNQTSHIVGIEFDDSLKVS
jgi:hypothetical protein